MASGETPEECYAALLMSRTGLRMTLNELICNSLMCRSVDETVFVKSVSLQLAEIQDRVGDPISEGYGRM